MIALKSWLVTHSLKASHKDTSHPLPNLSLCPLRCCVLRKPTCPQMIKLILTCMTSPFLISAANKTKFRRGWSHRVDAHKSWSALVIHFTGPKKWTGKALSAPPRPPTILYASAFCQSPNTNLIRTEMCSGRVTTLESNPTSLERRCGLTSNPLHKKKHNWPLMPFTH